MRFADTSFWYALQVTTDANHETAGELWRSNEGAVLTTTLVLGETWTLLRRRVHHRAAVDFFEGVNRSQRVDVVRVGPSEERDAWTWLARHDERAYSFVDATSFALMRERGIAEALAFDGDFSAAGFVEMRP